LLIDDEISIEVKGAVARARTIAALRSLDTSMNVTIMSFLRDSGYADFLTFRNATFTEIDVREADFARYDFTSAVIGSATNFIGTNLNGAIFADANMFETIMNGANLRGANCQNACFFNVDLKYADLRGADFTNT